MKADKHPTVNELISLIRDQVSISGQSKPVEADSQANGQVKNPDLVLSKQDTDQVPGIFLIVGLGNPGRRYLKNRHNVGFMVVDRLAGKLGVTFSRVQSKALVTGVVYEGQRLILAKPQSYMNSSGQVVGALIKFYKVSLECCLVIHDDVDLPLGVLRMRPGGSSGGQKGVASLIERLGRQDFPRLRVGIGRPPGYKQAAGYVLRDFSRSEDTYMQSILDRAVVAVLTYVAQGLERAMNQYNGVVSE